ncbi:MAG TPA: DoxX family protein [Candidatus Sulfotelmatobacter sp.]|nr:DoxX family protein [Candidatus Sulfotelmatobacter sp.]
MWQALLSTTPDPAVALVRIVLGLVILPHGLQKLFGWFGGGGLRGTLSGFASMGIPYPLTAAAITAESLGSVALIFGVFGRLAALGIAVVMLVATLRVHRPHGFFMNWYGQNQGEGFEYHLLAMALALVVIWHGSGAWSVDLWLSRLLH